jgi:hypothetical protein
MALHSHHHAKKYDASFFASAARLLGDGFGLEIKTH